MTPFQIFQMVMLALIVLAGAAIVLTRNPKQQICIAGAYAVIQAILSCTLHPSDVALSELAVGTIALPSLVLAALGKVEKKK